jgi:hypothetical protein
MLDNIPEETKQRVERQMNEPFSPFGRILPEEWWDWDERNWPEEEYIGYAAGEAWNVDEFTDRGYMAMKRMLHTLIDPKKECKTLEEFEQKLKELYDRTNSGRSV